MNYSIAWNAFGPFRTLFVYIPIALFSGWDSHIIDLGPIALSIRWGILIYKEVDIFLSSPLDGGLISRAPKGDGGLNSRACLRIQFTYLPLK